MNEITEPHPALGHRRQKDVTVTVIVVSYKTPELVRTCLGSVYRGATGRVEVIVVDNASGDGTVEMIRAEFAEATVIANSRNVGFAAANNQALAISRGRYVLLLNPDTEVAADTIDATVRFADANEDAAVVACRVMGDDGHQAPTLFRTMRLRHVVMNIFVPIRLARSVRWLGGARHSDLDLDQVHDVESVAGCFMLVRREACEAVGGLDEDFFIYGEEAEWCFRFRRAGWKIRYFPGARIMHHGGASTGLMRKPMNLALTRSLLLLLQKTQGRHVSYLGNLAMLVREIPRAVLYLGVRFLPGAAGAKASLRQSVERLPLHLAGIFRLDWRGEARKAPDAAASAGTLGGADGPG